jgi:hypothetical protein
MSSLRVSFQVLQLQVASDHIGDAFAVGRVRFYVGERMGAVQFRTSAGQDFPLGAIEIIQVEDGWSFRFGELESAIADYLARIVGPDGKAIRFTPGSGTEMVDNLFGHVQEYDLNTSDD